jgi:hypothetical protein
VEVKKMSEKKLVQFSLAALLAALAAPSVSPATEAVAATKADQSSDACAAGPATGGPEPGAGGRPCVDAGAAATGGAAMAPGGAAPVAAVRGKPGAIADGRLVILDADTGAFGIEGKNGLFRAPKGTDLASIGGKDVRVYANANGEVSAIEVVSGEAIDRKSGKAEPVQN